MSAREQDVVFCHTLERTPCDKLGVCWGHDTVRPGDQLEHGGIVTAVSAQGVHVRATDGHTDFHPVNLHNDPRVDLMRGVQRVDGTDVGIVTGHMPAYVRCTYGVRVDVLEVITDDGYGPRVSRSIVTGPADKVTKVLQDALQGGLYADRVHVCDRSSWTPARDGGTHVLPIPADVARAAGIGVAQVRA